MRQIRAVLFGYSIISYIAALLLLGLRLSERRNRPYGDGRPSLTAELAALPFAPVLMPIVGYRIINHFRRDR